MKREFLIYDRCDFILGAEEFLEEQIALIMPKSSPYLQLINKEIKILHQMGFIELWLREYLPKRDRCWVTRESNDAENHTVNLSDMEGCFLVLLIGVFLGTVFICFEFCWFYRHKYLTHKIFYPFVN